MSDTSLFSAPALTSHTRPRSSTLEEALYPHDQPDQPDHRRKSIDETRAVAPEGVVGFKKNLPTTRPASSASSPIAKVEVAFAKCASWTRVGTSRVLLPRARSRSWCDGGRKLLAACLFDQVYTVSVLPPLVRT
jgi:hypothetical protein